MKHVVSVSLGSSKRNHSVETEILGVPIRIERIGTDGSFTKAISLLKQLDGRVDAIGLGGIDLYLHCDDKRFVIRDARKLANAVRITPLVDGSGLKLTLEYLAIKKMVEKGLDLKNKKVLMVSAIDRWGMAKAFYELGVQVAYGDLVFGLGIPILIRNFETFKKIATKLAPIVVKMPFKMLYPTGKEQEKEPDPKFKKYYEEADVIAGDFLFIRKYMPREMDGKWIITNTTTKDDIEDLKSRGVELVVTTTPVYEGRSFGTNVMEAAFIAILEKMPEEVSEKDYFDLLEKMNYSPEIIKLK
ncbi:MAG: quinate 5-dehydrogenase [Actinobacteria bacterium]|nr:quinate 5-dehydrogenase [Actinomycetota bacterium]